MALLQWKAPVDYEAQLGTLPMSQRCFVPGIADTNSPGAFKTFLQDFKASPDEALTYALANVDIGGNDTEDEYDFMDEDDEDTRRRAEREAKKQPYHKYKDVMRQLADRKIDEVLIELDDLQQVCPILPNDTPDSH